MFIADSPDSTRVLVKLVSRRYGEDVQHLLANHGLAPKLYARSCPEGAPRAYAMEYLNPSNWKTLFDYLQPRDIDPSTVVMIRRSLGYTVDVLKRNGKVHGDLRSPNIMVNVSHDNKLVLVDDDSGSSRADMRVVDFDWAGDANRVHYPLSRNDAVDDITWPGKPGGLIERDHDDCLVHSWWKF